MLASVRFVKFARRCAASPMHNGTLYSPAPLKLSHRLSLELRCSLQNIFTHVIWFGPQYRPVMSVEVIDPILQMQKESCRQTPSQEPLPPQWKQQLPGRRESRCDVHGSQPLTWPAGRATTSAQQGLWALRARPFGVPGSLLSPPVLGPRPQVPHALPISLTVRSRQTASGKTGELRVRHSRPASNNHAPRRRRQQSLEGLQAPGKGKLVPSQAADISQSDRAPPVSAPPPTLQPLGLVGVSKAGLAARRGSRCEQADLWSRAKLHFPAGSAAAKKRLWRRAGTGALRGLRDGTLLKFAGVAARGRRLTSWAAARQGGNPGGGLLCN